LHSGWPENFQDWLGNIPWLGWIVLPYVAMYFGMRTYCERLSLSLANLMGVLVLTGFAIVVYRDGLILHPDAQSALLLVVIPLYQIVLYMLFMFVLLAARWFIRRNISAV
jgi:hypothetical protein